MFRGMTQRQLRVAIVGCGTLGEAILGGLQRADWLAADQLVATVRRESRAAELRATHGIEVTTDNVGAAASASVVVLAVKPQMVAELLAGPALRDALRDKLVISVAAGVGLPELEAMLPESTVVRAMPNTPCLIGEGMTVLSPSERATTQQLELTRRIFGTVGRVIELEEKHMDVVTSLNGSGPAFVYVMMEAMADGGVMMGLPRDVALDIAAQVFRGAGAMVHDTGAHPAALKDDVTTPAGCTIAGLLTMEDGRIRSVLARTIEEAARVAGGLGRSD